MNNLLRMIVIVTNWFWCVSASSRVYILVYVNIETKMRGQQGQGELPTPGYCYIMLFYFLYYLTFSHSGSSIVTPGLLPHRHVPR